MKQGGWLAIGGTLAAVTSALVVGLHLSRPTVPRAYTWEPGGIALVDAPPHAAAALRAARPHLASWGHRPPDVVLGAPVEDCDGLPCRAGWVVVTTWDPEPGAEDVLARAVHPPAGGWCTILLPRSYAERELVSLPWDDGDEGGGAPELLPPDIAAITVAHELLHCLGYGHAVTRGIASPTGHVLNPDLRRAGWSGAGIDGGTP